MIQDLINSEQNNVESRLLQPKPTYSSVILPSLKVLFEAFEKTDVNSLPTKLSISKPIDIYAEALTAYKIRNPHIILPIRLISFIIIYHPFMLTVFQLHHNSDSWESFRIKLLDSMNTDFDSLPQAKSIIPLLESKLDSTSLSAFQQFHYLMGFYFNSSTIAQTPKELKPAIDGLLKNNNIQSNQLIIIAINSSFNVTNTDSVVIYSNVPRTKARIINESTVETFNSIHQSPVKQSPTTPFNLLNINFEPIDSNDNYTHSLVVINYNDTTNYKNNHYTIAYFGKFGVLDKRLTQDFMSFKVIKTIDVRLLSFYLQESFYERIYTNNLTIDQLKRSYTQLMNAVSSSFNKTHTPSEFISTLYSNVSEHNLIDSHELPYFKVYLSKINKIQPYELPTVLSYVLNYIYPDLLTSSSSL